MNKMVKEGYYFLSISDKSAEKICKFSKAVEEKYDKDELSGLNFAKLKDGNCLLGLTFKKQKSQEEALKSAQEVGFKKISTKEETWTEIILLAEMCIVGNFSYNMLQNAEENMLMFDITTYKRLEKAYEQAVAEKKETFIFEEKELLTSYAKYLLQYLKGKLSR
jgi:hypothetical protein